MGLWWGLGVAWGDWAGMGGRWIADEGMNGVDIAGGGGEAEDFLMSLCEPPGAGGVDGIGNEV